MIRPVVPARRAAKRRRGAWNSGRPRSISTGVWRRRSATTPRTCSAIVARISAMPLLCGVGQLDQLRQFLAGLARVDRLRGKADAGLDARGPAAHVKRGAAVE